MAASVQPFPREPIAAFLLSPQDQGAGRSDFRVANPHALDRASHQTPQRSLFLTRFRLPSVPPFPGLGLPTVAIGTLLGATSQDSAGLRPLS
jgi:hypothetical protein